MFMWPTERQEIKKGYIGENQDDLEYGNHFLDTTPKTQLMK